MSIRTVDDSWVNINKGTTDWNEESATGDIIGVSNTDRYSLGGTIQYNGQARTEYLNASELSKFTAFKVVDFLEITEEGYIVEKENGETTHVKISELSDN